MAEVHTASRSFRGGIMMRPARIIAAMVFAAAIALAGCSANSATSPQGSGVL
jgi:hypothetical protein